MSQMSDITALQQRIAAAHRDRIRAEGARDAAQAAAATARAQLRTDFGVNTAQQAQELLGQLNEELTEIAAQISAALDKIGL
jgi:uncharacterized membrane-anchored protein